MTVLEVKNLQKSFGGVRAVRDLSFSVAAGEMLAMIGIITPAVSQVGELPASGISSKMHRRQGVLPGIIVIVVP